MDIFNFAEVKKSANVMGVIRGSVEPGETPPSPKSVLFLSCPVIDLWSAFGSVCVGVCRQIRDVREPQGQLGSRCHRPQQRDVCHAGAEPSAWQEGQAG